MNILGLAAPFGHDHAAALLIDGKIVAASEEERFTRKSMPMARCLLMQLSFA